MNREAEIYVDWAVDTAREIQQRHGIRGLPDDRLLSIAEEKEMVREMKRALKWDLKRPTRKRTMTAAQNHIIRERLSAAPPRGISKAAERLSEFWATLGLEYELDAEAIRRRYARMKK